MRKVCYFKDVNEYESDQVAAFMTEWANFTDQQEEVELGASEIDQLYQEQIGRCVAHYEQLHPGFDFDQLVEEIGYFDFMEEKNLKSSILFHDLSNVLMEVYQPYNFPEPGEEATSDIGLTQKIEKADELIHEFGDKADQVLSLLDAVVPTLTLVSEMSHLEISIQNSLINNKDMSREDMYDVVLGRDFARQVATSLQAQIADIYGHHDDNSLVARWLVDSAIERAKAYYDRNATTASSLEVRNTQFSNAMTVRNSLDVFYKKHNQTGIPQEHLENVIHNLTNYMANRLLQYTGKDISLEEFFTDEIE